MLTHSKYQEPDGMNGMDQQQYPVVAIGYLWVIQFTVQPKIAIPLIAAIELITDFYFYKEVWPDKNGSGKIKFWPTKKKFHKKIRIKLFGHF